MTTTKHDLIRELRSILPNIGCISDVPREGEKLSPLERFAQVSDSDTLIDGIIDSLGAVSLVNGLEQKFDIEIYDDEVNVSVFTLSGLADLIIARIHG